MAHKVCIVDDDTFYGEILSNLLSMQGFEPQYFSSAADCLEALATAGTPEPYDAFVLDVVMPEMDGYSLCANLRKRERFATTPVLFVSSKHTLEDRMRGYESGGNDYLGKPVQPDELKVKLEQVIKHASAQKALAAQSKQPVSLDQEQYHRQIVDYVERCEQETQWRTLSDALLSCLSVLGLNASVMLRFSGMSYFVAADGSEHAIEKELLELAVENNTEIEFNQRLILNYPLVSLLIRRLPEVDDDQLNKLKQQLSFLVRITNSRLRQLAKEDSDRKQREYWLDLLVNAEKAMDHSTANEFYRENTIADIMEEFVISLDEGLLDLALDKDQEVLLKQMFRQKVSKLTEMLNAYSKQVEEVRHPFQELLETLKRGRS